MSHLDPSTGKTTIRRLGGYLTEHHQPQLNPSFFSPSSSSPSSTTVKTNVSSRGISKMLAPEGSREIGCMTTTKKVENSQALSHVSCRQSVQSILPFLSSSSCQCSTHYTTTCNTRRSLRRHLSSHAIFSSFLLILLSLLGSSYSDTRPFYNIAHMVNSIKEVNYYLSRGANAIEADVAFSPNGSALYTFHGYPCDCFRHCTEREDIDKYLQYVREVTEPDSPYYKRQLSLLFLDVKISGLHHSVKATAGKDMASRVIDHLFENGKSTSKVNLLLSIGHVYDSDFILGFQNELESRDLAQNLSSKIGWDVGLNDPVSTIVSMWKRIEVIDNIWQGDGRSNCLSPFYNLGRLTKVIERRDERNDMIANPYIDKVYHWTIDLTHNLRASLRTGVDGIITNHPERLVNILRETEFSNRFRLADQEDNPWERIQAREDANPSPAAPVTQPVSARWASGLTDMVVSFAKYLRDFVYLRVPSYHNIS